jgi:hypothetical protein
MPGLHGCCATVLSVLVGVAGSTSVGDAQERLPQQLRLALYSQAFETHEGLQATIAAGARARMQSKKLGVGWRTGHIEPVAVPGPIAGSVRCLAFVPDPPTTISRIMISVSDTLELWVAHAPDSTSTRGSWVGVPRADRLKASCQMP